MLPIHELTLWVTSVVSQWVWPSDSQNSNMKINTLDHSRFCKDRLFIVLILSDPGGLIHPEYQCSLLWSFSLCLKRWSVKHLPFRDISSLCVAVITIQTTQRSQYAVFTLYRHRVQLYKEAHKYLLGIHWKIVNAFSSINILWDNQMPRSFFFSVCPIAPDDSELNVSLFMWREGSPESSDSIWTPLYLSGSSRMLGGEQKLIIHGADLCTRYFAWVQKRKMFLAFICYQFHLFLAQARQEVCFAPEREHDAFRYIFHCSTR